MERLKLTTILAPKPLLAFFEARESVLPLELFYLLPKFRLILLAALSLSALVSSRPLFGLHRPDPFAITALQREVESISCCAAAEQAPRTIPTPPQSQVRHIAPQPKPIEPQKPPEAPKPAQPEPPKSTPTPVEAKPIIADPVVTFERPTAPVIIPHHIRPAQ